MSKRARRVRVLVALLVGSLAALALTGCLRVRTDMTIGPQDRVSGEIVFAALPVGPEDAGPQPTVPPRFTERVNTLPYELEGYVGTRLFFDDLSLVEFNDLARALLGPQFSSTASLELRRAGSLLTLTGGADLTRLAADQAEVQVRVTFPGEVTDSNGEEDSRTVTWELPGGEVSQLRAVAESEDPDAPPLLLYAALGGAGLMVLALLVAVLAFVAHLRAARAE